MNVVMMVVVMRIFFRAMAEIGFATAFAGLFRFAHYLFSVCE